MNGHQQLQKNHKSVCGLLGWWHKLEMATLPGIAILVNLLPDQPSPSHFQPNRCLTDVWHFVKSSYENAEICIWGSCLYNDTYSCSSISCTCRSSVTSVSSSAAICSDISVSCFISDWNFSHSSTSLSTYSTFLACDTKRQLIISTTQPDVSYGASPAHRKSKNLQKKNYQPGWFTRWPCWWSLLIEGHVFCQKQIALYV